jgi:peptidoglycan-associated lipoprotein
MFLRFPKLCAAVIIAGSVIAAGCRHAKVAAASPAVAPTPPVKTAALPETRVESPAKEFTAPEGPPAGSTDDPSKATLLAEKNGWIRDAFFDFDSTAIRPEAGKNLQATAQWLRDHGRFHVLVEGHCDERGTEQYNLALGEKRAWEAKEYLAVLGIDPQKMTTISYGKDKPFEQGHDEEAWASNRRAHVVLTSSAK